MLKRNFLPQNIQLNAWQDIEKYFIELNNKEINSISELEQWMEDVSELQCFISEDLAWRYIKMTIDTTNKEFSDKYNLFISEIQPKIAPFEDGFNKKLVSSPFFEKIDQLKYKNHILNVLNDIEIFREKNIPITSEEQQKSQDFGSISGNQSISYNGNELTLQQASKFLKNTDREIRKEVYELINQRRYEDKDQLNELLSELINLRTQIAQNADFENYRDYKHKELGRFDYTKEDCFDFHQSVKESVVPFLDNIMAQRKKELGYEVLYPYDTSVDTEGREPLKPFETGKELLNKTIQMFHRVKPYYGECLSKMNEMNHLDLESKKGKAPGGYNYPLYESGVPFIFMNAVGSQRDLLTMVHEGGHAIHSFLTKDLDLITFKSVPSEVAELASMSMELISMDYWDEFYPNPEDLKRAKSEQLEDVLTTLPWIATVDKFQHWLYENPTHSVTQREEAWIGILDQFSSNIVDKEVYQKYRPIAFQRQLHIYEVPFYYIEYGFAQLGAIAIWRNFKSNPEKALQQYEAALSLGYTKSIPEVYEAAGIKFDFSNEYVKELMDFVWKEYQNINN